MQDPFGTEDWHWKLLFPTFPQIKLGVTPSKINIIRTFSNDGFGRGFPNFKQVMASGSSR